jgi:translocator protein
MKFRVLIFCILFVYLFAIIGSFFTNTGEWYESVKPSIAPPNYVFPIVWSMLFLMIGFSLYYSIISNKDKKKIIGLFLLNLILNSLWSFLYFGLQKPFYAFIEIFFLDASILLLIIATYKIDRKASYLLIPYFLWVSFAIILNFLSII